MNPKEFFIRETISHARSLPFADAIVFLKGMLLSCEDTEATGEIRKIYIQLSESDNQLQLIQSGQMKLNL